MRPLYVIEILCADRISGFLNLGGPTGLRAVGYRQAQETRPSTNNKK